jgi:DNA polymerase delta subunit 1
MINKKIVGCSWLTVLAGRYKLAKSYGQSEMKKTSSAQLEIICSHNDIISHPAEGYWSKNAPFRILSFGIKSH